MLPVKDLTIQLSELKYENLVPVQSQLINDSPSFHNARI